MAAGNRSRQQAQDFKADKEVADNPYSDSAEYKMWGNGVALPCVVFVLSGIVYYSQFPTE